jgi:hypothetical protein
MQAFYVKAAALVAGIKETLRVISGAMVEMELGAFEILGHPYGECNSEVIQKVWCTIPTITTYIKNEKVTKYVRVKWQPVT